MTHSDRVRIEGYLRSKWGGGEALRHEKATTIEPRGRYAFAGSHSHLPSGANSISGVVRTSGVGGGGGSGDPASGLEADPAALATSGSVFSRPAHTLLLIELLD